MRFSTITRGSYVLAIPPVRRTVLLTGLVEVDIAKRSARSYAHDPQTELLFPRRFCPRMPKQPVHPFKAILSQELVTIAEWGHIEPVDAYQRRMLDDLLSVLLTPAPPRFLNLLYRGDSKSQLATQLFANGAADPPDEILYGRLFYFGAKARHFYHDPDDEVTTRRPLRSVVDVSPETFQWLFAEIARILRYRHKRVLAFRERNTDFTEYFGDRANLVEFTEQVGALPPFERHLARDYYLFFLHTFGRRGIHRQTMLVSTSRSIKQARRFRSKRRDNLLLYIFLPPSWSRFAVSSFPGKYNAILKRIGAPVYARGRGLYPEQQEVAVRGAIFPQHILGVRDEAMGCFVVNPHLFRMSPCEIAEIPHRGIQLDQTGFEQLARETGFFRYVALNRKGYRAIPPHGAWHGAGRLAGGAGVLLP